LVIGHQKSVRYDNNGLIELVENYCDVFEFHSKNWETWYKDGLFILNEFEINCENITYEQAREAFEYVVLYCENRPLGISKYRGLLVTADHLASCLEWSIYKTKLNIVPDLSKGFKIPNKFYPLSSVVSLEKKHTFIISPTGSGKTIMFTFIVSEHLKRGGSVLVFTHRKELLNQAGSSFEKFNLKPDFIRAGEYPSLDGTLHVSMIETFARRIEKYDYFLQTRTMIIFDEAHLENFTKIFPYISENTIVIGATATPLRKGNQKSLSDFYTDLVQEIDTPELIDLGFLSRAKSYGVKIDLSNCIKQHQVSHHTI